MFRLIVFSAHSSVTPLLSSSDQAEMRAREDALTAALADELAAGDAERKEV